ncbi:MAG: hypothetical protein WDM80_08315 [Limisphaerales bacterium]
MLVVPIPGTSFPDDGEWRLRQRYSLEMALAQSGYQPDGDGRHLGYVTLDWLEQGRIHPFVFTSDCATPTAPADTNIDYSVFNTNPTGKPLLVPYEWFASPETNNPSVLLVWLQTEFLDTEPLCRLAYLRHTLMPANLAGTNFAGTFFIGPYTSLGLSGIVKDLNDLQTNAHICTDLLSDKLCILSPLATAPDALIELPPTNHWNEARWALDGMLHKKLGGTNWAYFKNFIAPDDQLTDLLARELKLRNILEDKTDRVLVLTEADTSYGRALPLAFKSSLQSLSEGFESNSSPTATNLANVVSNQTAYPNTNLIIARYLQGLDAQKGFQEDNKNGTKGTAGKTTAQALEEVLNKQAATAVGDSQLDYSERLAQRLSEEVQDKNNVKAVGVLGSDVYDKLILLRSLRRQFPEALFFTTDLDARLWHPDHLHFTRNLIVASAYPLTETNGASSSYIGFKMAPFRNSYQMAMFQASVTALMLATNLPATNLPDIPAPQIYEVGRDGPFRLKPANAACLTNSFCDQFKTAISRFGDGRGRACEFLDTHIKASRCALFGMAFAILTFWVYSRRLKLGTSENREVRLTDIFRKRTGWVGWFLFLLCVVIALVNVFFHEAARIPGGEPWSWTNGVSIWPTEIFRLILFILVFWMLMLAWQRYRRHSRWLEEEFKFNLEPTIQAGPTTDGDEPEKVFAKEVWKKYRRKAALPSRCGRTLLGTLGYFLMAFSLILFTHLPVNTQVRGGLAQDLDFWIMIFSVFASLFLLFYVLDAVWLSSTMLEELAEPFTVWNDALVQEKFENFRVVSDDVEGYLDVLFAAKLTNETGKIIFLPFVIQFFMLVSRNSFFDNWGWPIGLVIVLVCNMVLAAIAWSLLRRARCKSKGRGVEKTVEKPYDCRTGHCLRWPQLRNYRQFARPSKENRFAGNQICHRERTSWRLFQVDSRSGAARPADSDRFDGCAHRIVPSAVRLNVTHQPNIFYY